MDRIEAVERSAAVRHGGKRTWDLFHVWPDGTVRDGVRFTSTLHVYLAEPRASAAKVRMWNPGGPQGDVEFKLAWGEELWAPVAGWGIASVVSGDDAPLHVFWELSPGKAEAASGQKALPSGEPQIRAPKTPLPLP